MGPFFVPTGLLAWPEQSSFWHSKRGVGKTDVRLMESFGLAFALPLDEADPILTAHLCDHPCLAFESLLLGVVSMHVKGILAPDSCRDLLRA